MTHSTTFDFQAVTDKLKESQKQPFPKKCVVELTSCEELESEGSRKETVPSSPEPVIGAAQPALDATFDLGSPDIPVSASLDATFVKKTSNRNNVHTSKSIVESTLSPAKAPRKSARNSAKSDGSEDPSEFFDAIQSPAVKRMLAVSEEVEDVDSSASLFESSLPDTPVTVEKQKPQPVVPTIPVPNKEANETICLVNPSYLPKSALQPPSAALRLGPWLPLAPTTGLDAVIEEDSQESIGSGHHVHKSGATVAEKNLPVEKLPGPERSLNGTTSSSSSSSSSGSSFKSAKCFPLPSVSANAKPLKCNFPPKELWNFTKKNQLEREKEALKKKDEVIQQKKDIQQKKNEEWAKRAEKIRLEEVKKREEAEKKLQRDEAERKLQEEAIKNKAKPPTAPVINKPPKPQEKHVFKPLTAPKLAFGHSSSLRIPEAQGGCSNLAFKPSGPMSGFKSASSDSKLAYQSKIKTVMGQSTPKHGAQSTLLKVTKGNTESSNGFKVPDVPVPNYNYSFLDTTHENSYISSYEITRYEDLDEDMTHREDKHVPEWAQNKEELTCALFKQSLMGQFPTAKTPFPKPDRKFKLFP